MRRLVLTLVVAGFALRLGADIVQACGDKFLLNGRGANARQAYAALYTASVVVLAQPQRSSSAAIRDARLLADLKKAGHHVALVEDERALTRLLETERIDILLADGADADRLAAQVQNVPARPKVVPVLFKPSKADEKAMEARHQICLSTSDKSLSYLAAIDEVMKARKKKTV